MKAFAVGKTVVRWFNVASALGRKKLACAIIRLRTYPREIGPHGFADLWPDRLSRARAPQPIVAEISPTSGII